MQYLTRRTLLAAAPATLAFGGPLLAARPARAKQYGPGVTDTEIKIGNTGPYSGPLSNASPIPISMAAYFKMINEQGGINGRKITFISYDDGYSPPKTVEMTRKLVESDEVLFIAGAARHPDQQRDLALHEREEGAAVVRQHRRHQMGRPEGPSLDDGLFRQLPGRGAHLCRLHPEGQARRQDRRALSERRFRQGLSEGAARRARRQGRVDDQGQGFLRNHRRHRRLRKSSTCRRRAAISYSRSRSPNSGHGDPKGGRNRMEAAVYHSTASPRPSG